MPGRLRTCTTAPRQIAGDVKERIHDVEQGPGDDDDVVDVLQEYHHECGVPDALENGTELPDDAHAAHAQVLTDADLQQEERNSARDHGQKVGDEKSAYWGASWMSRNEIENKSEICGPSLVIDIFPLSLSLSLPIASHSIPSHPICVTGCHAKMANWHNWNRDDFYFTPIYSMHAFPPFLKYVRTCIHSYVLARLKHGKSPFTHSPPPFLKHK